MTLALGNRRWLAAAVMLAFVCALAVPQMSHAAPESPARADATKRLFNAVYANDFAAVQASIASGADIDARNAWGVTPADLAVDKGYFRIAHYLVSVRGFQRAKTEQASAMMQDSGAAATARANPPSGNDETGLASGGKPAPARSTSPTSAMPPRQPEDAHWPQLSDSSSNPFDPRRPAFGTVLTVGGEPG